MSTAEIGRRLGISKNAVVGKAHRLTLPARPSPIRRDGSSAPRSAAPRRVVGSTLPPLPAGGPMPEVDRPPPVEAEPATAAAIAEPPPPAAAPEIPAAPMRVVAAASRRGSACCWPLGDPGTSSFRFCDGAALPGKPYCAEHAQVAYVKVRDRREEAA